MRTLRGKRGKQGAAQVLRGLLKNAHSARIVPRKLGPGTPQAQFRSLSSLSIAPQHFLSRLLHSHPQKEPAGVGRGSLNLGISKYSNGARRIQKRFPGTPRGHGAPRHPKDRNHSQPPQIPQPAPIRRAPFARQRCEGLLRCSEIFAKPNALRNSMQLSTIMHQKSSKNRWDLQKLFGYDLVFYSGN